MNNIKSTSEFGITSRLARVVRSILPQGVALLCSLPLVGCLAQTGDADGEAVDVVQQAALTNNALTNNALTNNALTNNALTNNALTNNALTNNALTNNALANNSLTDPNAREVLKYIVSCALPRGAEVSFVAAGVSYTYPGEIGLAPSWGQANGTCGASCQQWVSACVMSRVDYLGEKVLISVRGDHPALNSTSAERSAYSVREGTYFGNIFASTTQRYACVSPERTALTRVCGPTTAGCAVEVLGSCSTVCDSPRSDGSFPRCSNANSSALANVGGDDAGDDDQGSPATTYNGTVTVFLAP